MSKLSPQLLQKIEGKGPHERVVVRAILNKVMLTDEEYKALDMMGCKKLGESTYWIGLEVDIDRIEPLSQLPSVSELR